MMSPSDAGESIGDGKGMSLKSCSCALVMLECKV